MKDQLNHHGRRLEQLLTAAANNQQQRQHAQLHEQKVHVAGAGGVITAAYEQLRNAAENAEEHVLL